MYVCMYACMYACMQVFSYGLSVVLLLISGITRLMVGTGDNFEYKLRKIIALPT
jgi:hypothetical protein